MTETAKVIQKGPVYICDGCRSLVFVPDDLLKHETIIEEDDEGEFDVIESTFECPQCKEISVAFTVEPENLDGGSEGGNSESSDVEPHRPSPTSPKAKKTFDEVSIKAVKVRLDSTRISLSRQETQLSNPFGRSSIYHTKSRKHITFISDFQCRPIFFV